MTYTMLKFYDNYADEFDVEGFVVVKSEFAKKWLRLAGVFEGEISLGFGSNEYIEYRNGSNFVRNVTSKVITDEEANTLVNLFTENSNYCNVIAKYGIASYFYENMIDTMAENAIDVTELIVEIYS